MSWLQSIFMAVLQGVSELFPVSSLGHAVILPRLLHWAVDQKAADWLAYLVVMHLGTAIALLIYFWRDWLTFALSILSPAGARSLVDRRIFLFLVLATLPTVVAALLFRKAIGEAFGTPTIAAIFLIVNGLILWAGDKIGGTTVGTLEQLNWKGALAIGVAQCAALVPGVSRSGATIVAGVLAGLQHREAARFSFLMAPPIIIGAGILEAPKLLHEGATLGGAALVSGIVAGIVAYISTTLLMRYFRGNELEALEPFAYYCWAAGAISLALIALT